MSQLRLSLLGPPQVWADNTPLTFATRKALALLIYLVVEGGSQPRDKLLALLWPDSAPKRGRGVLRTTLAYLRRALDASPTLNSAAWLMVEADTLAFDFKADYDLDLHQVEIALAATPVLPTLSVGTQAGSTTRSGQPALLEQVATLYRGDFLAGFSLSDAPVFDEWASVQREIWHRQMSAVFDRLAQWQADERQFEAGIATAARWVAHDPLDETAHRRLMQLHALKGDRTAALQAYAACQTTLRVELGIQPSAETSILAERIRNTKVTGRSSDKAISHPRPPASRSSFPVVPFVGRSAEYAQLAATYQNVCQGQTRVVLIEGEAGIGKTRLAAEFLNWLIFHGADVLRGRAFEAGGRLAYQPIIEMIRERIEQENAPDDLLSDIWLAELSRLLPELAERYPDLPPPTADETLAQARLLEALARLGQALAARRPVIWFIDDVQWADVTSLDVLSYLSRVWVERGVPALLLLSIRAEALIVTPTLNEWFATLARAAPLIRLNLGPLTAAEIRQLVEALQGTGGVGEAARRQTLSTAQFADWLFAETAGQPFYISETLKMLQEQRTLQAQTDPEGRWRIDLAGNLPPLPAKGQAAVPLIPSGVRQIILARLNRLTLDATALLTAAAVIGRPCSFERLSQVADLAENESLLALDELLRGRLLLETHQTTRPYTLAHDKIRDVVYTEAGAARRQVYHRRAFERLEAIAASPAELAHHALAAQLIEPTFRYSLAAGDEAMRLFAVRDAVTYYEQAQVLVSEKEEIQNPPEARRAKSTEGTQSEIQHLYHLYLQLGRAYELTNAWDKARTTYETMLALAQEAHAPAMEGVALNRLATLAVHDSAYDLAGAAALLHQALAVAESSDDQVGVAETEWNLAQLGIHQLDLEAALRHGQRALTLARTLDLPELTARSLNILAFAEMGVSQWLESEAHAEEGRALYQTLGNRAMQADCLGYVTMSRVNCGRSQEGITSGQSAWAISLEIENGWGQANNAFQLALALLESGAYEEALGLTQRGLAMARELGVFAPLQILNLIVLGNTYRAMLALEAARTTHLEALALSNTMPSSLFTKVVAAELCADCALAGLWSEAYSYARQALAAPFNSFLHGGLSHWYEIEALVRVGDWELAQAEVNQFGQRFAANRRYHIPYLRSLAVLNLTPQSPLLKGKGEKMRKRRSAITHLEEALALAEEMELPGEQWSILAHLSKLYQANGVEAKAREAMIQAAEIVETLAAKIGDEDLRVGFLRGIKEQMGGGLLSGSG